MNTLFRAAVVAGLTLALAPWSHAQDEGQPAAGKPAKGAKTIEGKLTADAAEQVHKVDMKAGQRYRIEMKSADFDTYLRVRNPDGQEVAQDDDGGEGLNSRLTFTPDKDGAYSVVATSFGNDGVGDYTLTVQAAPVVDTKVAAKKLAAGQPVEGELTAEQAEQAYQVPMKAGQKYVIEMKSEAFDTMLRVRNSDGQELASDDDGGGGLNSRLEFTPQKDDTYAVVAASFGDNGTGEYTLRVQGPPKGKKGDEPKTPGANPKEPTEQPKKGAQAGKIIEGKLTADQTEQLHKTAMKAGKMYLIQMKSTDFDTYLRVRDPDGQEVAEDDDGGGMLNSQLMFTPEKDATYAVVATSFQTMGTGDYTLEIRQLNKAGKPKVEEGKLDNNSGKIKDKFYHPHKLKLTAGKTYQIDLESKDFDALMAVRKADGGEQFLAGNDDVAPGNLNARVFFTPSETGEYEVLAASLDDNLGNYTLTVQEFASGGGAGGQKNKQPK